MVGTHSNKAPKSTAGRLLGRWLWLIGLTVGILSGAAVAVGFTSATAPAEQRD
jgi:hypothetical protein